MGDEEQLYTCSHYEPNNTSCRDCERYEGHTHAVILGTVPGDCMEGVTDEQVSCVPFNPNPQPVTNPAADYTFKKPTS